MLFHSPSGERKGHVLICHSDSSCVPRIAATICSLSSSDSKTQTELRDIGPYHRSQQYEFLSSDTRSHSFQAKSCSPLNEVT